MSPKFDDSNEAAYDEEDDETKNVSQSKLIINSGVIYCNIYLIYNCNVTIK